MKKNILHNILITLTILIVSTLICFLLDLLNLDIMNFMIIYVLGILMCAIFTTGYIPAISLSLLSVLAFNLFFTVPRYTFKVDDPKYIVTIILVMLVGVIISSIVYRLKTYTKRVSDLKIEQLKIKNDMEKEQIKSTMLRGISHDLRTPLTTIKNGIEIILKDNISKDEKIEVGKKVSQKCDWTIRLMNNLLSLTRINGEDFTVKKNLELVEEVLSEAIRNLEDLIGKRHLHFELPEDILLVPMDGILIVQVLFNIISNAIRYTKEEGNIYIKVWNTTKQCVFRISNDGPLINDSDLPHLFELYYSTDRYSGNEYGIGLAICKMIIEAHKGTIEARNSNNMVIFEFTLPMEEKNYA